MRRGRGAWYLRVAGGQGEPKVDQERFDAFTDRLLNLRTIPGAVDEAVDEARWTLRFVFDENTASPPLVIPIAAPGEDGAALARRSDRPEGQRLEPTDLAFLDRGWWTLAQRFVTASNEADITEIKLRDRREAGEGEFHVVKGTDADGENEWRVGPRPVAAEFIRPLLGRIAFLGVDDYLGPLGGRAELAGVEPRFEISWRIPTVDAVSEEWVRWRVIARHDDQRWACTIDHFPDLVFLVRGEDLLVVENALRGIRRS